jgi:excisionase family DNA binding protein
VLGLVSVSAEISPLFVIWGNYSSGTIVLSRIMGDYAILLVRGILWAMKIISTAEAARKLGVSANRVRALIDSNRLKAMKVGREWLIDPKDLDAVKNRTPGRPRNSRKNTKR